MVMLDLHKIGLNVFQREVLTKAVTVLAELGTIGGERVRQASHVGGGHEPN